MNSAIDDRGPAIVQPPEDEPYFYPDGSPYQGYADAAYEAAGPGPHFYPIPSPYQGYNGAAHEADRVLSSHPTVRKSHEVKTYNWDATQHYDSYASISTTSTATDVFTNYGLHRALNRTPTNSPLRNPTKKQLKDQKYLEHSENRYAELTNAYNDATEEYLRIEEERTENEPIDYKLAIALDKEYYEAYLRMNKAERALNRFANDTTQLRELPKVTRQNMEAIFTKPREVAFAQEMQEASVENRLEKLERLEARVDRLCELLEKKLGVRVEEQVQCENIPIGTKTEVERFAKVEPRSAV